MGLHLSRYQTPRGGGGDFALTLLESLVPGVLPSVCLNVLCHCHRCKWPTAPMGWQHLRRLDRFLCPHANVWAGTEPGHTALVTLSGKALGSRCCPMSSMPGRSAGEGLTLLLCSELGSFRSNSDWEWIESSGAARGCWGVLHGAF